MAEEGKLSINIVTPAGEKLSGQADEIVAPGHTGEFGVMPGHIEFFIKNPPGVFTAIDGGKKSYWAVGKGFIEVGGDHIHLLVQSAEKAEDIDTDRAQASKSRAEEELAKLEGNLSDPAYEHQMLKFNRSEARLVAAAMSKQH